ncbi:MAG: ribonuclease III [Myxococcales bacterium]|nr:ribonuclease III [Myxococcales bacterium]
MSEHRSELDELFDDAEWLQQALTHPSFRNESAGCKTDNQRLEFLGDTVIGMAVSTTLFRALPSADEGTLSALRSRVVSEPVLAQAARSIGLSGRLRLGRGVLVSGGQDRDSVLCDAFEAVIGALYLDSDYDKAAQTAVSWLQSPLDEALEMGGFDRDLQAVYRHSENWKTALQEWLQGHGLALPTYRIIAQHGPAHAPEFVVKVVAVLSDRSECAEGRGPNKKLAERHAAQALYTHLTSDNGLMGGCSSDDA